jgi:hypothetical protein
VQLLSRPAAVGCRQPDWMLTTNEFLEPIKGLEATSVGVEVLILRTYSPFY